MNVMLVILSLLVLVLVNPLAPAAQSSIPKEGRGTLTNHLTGTTKTLSMERDRAQLTYEVLGVATNEAGKGFGHNVSSRCVGSLQVIKGEFNNESGMCTFMDQDGDRVFSQYTGAGRSGEAAKGKGEYVGGTGKYAGISGSYEFTRTSLRPIVDGTSASISKATYTYRLP